MNNVQGKVEKGDGDELLARKFGKVTFLDENDPERHDDAASEPDDSEGGSSDDGSESENSSHTRGDEKPRGHRHEDKEAKKERKKAVKEEAREKRKGKRTGKRRSGTPRKEITA